jgi:O-antigen/teichoic acid export membrane protein
MRMNQERRFLLSAVTNWLAFAATLMTAFFLSPYLVRKLGDSQYGVWVFVESILAYFTLFDLGIAACVVRFVARFHTSRDQHELNRLVSSCLILFLGLGVIAFVIGLAVIPLVSPTMGKSGMERSEIIAFSLLMLGNLALTLPLSLFPAVLDGLERFAIKSAVRIALLAIRTTAMIVLMEHRPSLMGLGIILTICNLAENCALTILTFVYLPRLRISVRLVDRATLTLVKGYSIDAFLAMIAGRVSVQSGAIVIGICLSAPEITWFAIALRLVEFAKGMLRSATTTLTPAISSLETKGNMEAIRSVLVNGTRWSLYLILPVHAGLILLGQSFLRIWMGSENYSLHCYPALMILAAPLSLAIAQSVAGRVLYGMGRLRLYSRLTLLEAAVNLGLSLILVRRFGIEGVAWAAAIPSALSCLFVIDYVGQLVGVSRRAYFMGAWLKPLAACAAPFAVWFGSWTISGWADLAIVLTAGLVPYLVVALVLEGVVFRLRPKTKIRVAQTDRARLSVLDSSG